MMATTTGGRRRNDMARQNHPKDDDGPPAPRRSYESPVRRQQAAETRERIVAAGADLVHSFPRWDWRQLTVRAVAERAGVDERTVYRHFSSEDVLHAAVMQRLEEEADIDLTALALEDLTTATRNLFGYLSSFPVSERRPRDPTFAEIDERRRAAILDAVAHRAEDWSDTEQEQAAAVLDLLWSLLSYERLVTAWDLDSDDATAAVTWAIGLIEEAIRDGRRPSAP
jgi:AcrR family transcriptional regulator